AGRRAQGKRSARRQGHDRRGVQGNRLQAVDRTAAGPPAKDSHQDPVGAPAKKAERAPDIRGNRMLKFLDHLEEWLIAFLMGAPTLLIFVAVGDRCAAGLPIPGLQDALLKIDLSWAQELCIYMFVWMAKFGAA